MDITFKAKIWVWNSSTSWYGVHLPKKYFDEIKEFSSLAYLKRRGFGAVKVDVELGGSKWTTSIFPDNELGQYILFLKKAIRKAEDVDIDDSVSVKVTLIEP